MWVTSSKVLATLGGSNTQQNTLQIVESKSEVLCTEEMQGTMMKRHATNGVNRHRLDELVQKKHVGIHKVCWGNKWMGSSNFGTLNKTTSQTAGQGLKTNKTTRSNCQQTQQNK